MSRVDAVTKAVVDSGYDAMRVIDPKGGDFLVIFDPKDIVIVK